MQALCGYDFNGYALSADGKAELDKAILLPILNNMALCMLKMNSPHGTSYSLRLIEQVLRVDPMNDKALLRKSVIFRDLGRIDLLSPHMRVL